MAHKRKPRRRPARTLTAAMLQARGACWDGLFAFQRRYPRGLRLRGPCPANIPPEWMAWAKFLLTAPAWDEYRHVTAPAQAEYDRVTAAARAEYERVKTAALWAALCTHGIAAPRKA